MPKQKLFDDDSEADEEIALETKNEYAKKYDAWREKEEIHKLEQKYGPKALNSDASLSSDSEDESDEAPEIPEEVEEQFLKTLSLLKTKDPRIYDPNYKFFEEKDKKEVKDPKKKTLTFDDSDEDDDDDGNIFSIEKKAEIAEDKESHHDSKSFEKTGKEGKLKDYLTGKVNHIDDPVEKDLEPLKALWSDPKLSEGEAFLRDYILNKRYLDEDDAGAPEDKVRDDDDLEADEKMVEEQGKFERAYNFRFEEPDHEYLKRFPRTMNYIRPKDERRARKRAEARQRKEEEKQKKMEEIARLKALKLKEIREKIAKIKEVTGNQQLAFREEDIEGDFDPEQHDRRMKALFDDHYYGEEENEKPVFPDIDDENLDNEYEAEQEPAAGGAGTYGYEGGDERGDGPHCEDEDFNMDADYDRKRAREKLIEEIQSTLGKKRRNRKKKSKLDKLLSMDEAEEEKKTYEQYMDELYRMDCEDVIGGDLPTRFKYREVVPNDYGLSIEEILMADDKELTQWVPIKKLVKHKPESVQRSEVYSYQQKAADINLKKKILPSLFRDLPENPEDLVPPEPSKKKKKKKDKKNNAEITTDIGVEINASEDNNGSTETKDKKQKHQIINEDIDGSGNEAVSDMNNVYLHDEEQNGNVSKKSKKKKKKLQAELALQAEELNTNETDTREHILETNNSNVCPSTKDDVNNKESSNKKKKKLNQKIDINNSHAETSAGDNLEYSNDQSLNVKKGKKKKQHFEVQDALNVTPSQSSTIVVANTQTNKLKRKADHESQQSQSQIPTKKKKNKSNLHSNKAQDAVPKDKEFQNKFNKKHKFVNKQSNDKSSNPLNKLSDERLKAYGLNPKKYKKFLQYKKF